MTQIPMRDGLILAGILFSLGLTSLLVPVTCFSS